MMALETRPAIGPKSASKIEVLTDWSGFADLARPWDELNRASKSGPFVSHQWLTAWFEAFGHRIQPRVVQVWRDGLLVAAAPLGVSSQPLGAKARFVTVQTLQMLSNHRTGYNDWLVAPGYGDTISLLFEGMMHRTGAWCVAELEPFRQSAVLDRLIETAREQRIRFFADTTIQSAVVDLSKGWHTYLAGRPRAFRRDLRVAQKRVEATNHRILRGRAGDGESLERILSLSNRSWKGKSGTALGASQATRGFMRQLWSNLGPAGGVELWLLEIEGKEAGSVVSILDGDAIYGFATDFDEHFSRLSPGRFLVSKWLQDGIARGFKRADMLRRTPFLQEFSDEFYGMAQVRLFPNRSPAYLWLMMETRLRSLGREWRARRRYRLKRRAAHKHAEGSRVGG